LDVDEKKSQHHRRPRPRHKRRRAKPSGTTDASNSPADQDRLSSLPRIHKGKVTYKDHSSDEESQAPVVEEVVQPNKEEKWQEFNVTSEDVTTGTCYGYCQILLYSRHVEH
jgi:hypothetical protein